MERIHTVLFQTLLLDMLLSSDSLLHFPCSNGAGRSCPVPQVGQGSGAQVNRRHLMGVPPSSLVRKGVFGACPYQIDKDNLFMKSPLLYIQNSFQCLNPVDFHEQDYQHA